VQHIAAGFTQGLADWLTATTGLSVQLARHGESTRPGAAYLAPDGCQMSLGRDFRIACEDQPAEHGLRPSVSFLFRTVAQRFGAEAAGVLLTGMGCDGAEELKRMRDAGAITFAQDKESSVVHGMPGEALRLGAAMHVGPPERIAALLHSLLTPRRSHDTP
jgi:two-component system chemotaxis response regulator CheB